MQTDRPLLGGRQRDELFLLLLDVNTVTNANLLAV